jgi:glutathione S-transferase
MSLKLYERTDCPFCWKVRIAMSELNLGVEKYNSNLGEPHPEVLRLSPKKTVPVLLDGDYAIWESGVILEYLSDLRGDGTLFPEDPRGCANVRLLHQYSDTVVGPALRGLVFERRSKAEADWDLDLINQSEMSWDNCLEWLQQSLAGQEYFAGEFSAADCALAARFGVAEAYSAGVDDRFPELLQWFDRMKHKRSWGESYPSSFI